MTDWKWATTDGHAGAAGAGGQRCVTVVVVSHNGRRHLAACLDSLLKQDFPAEEYEVAVVDNASEDGSADLVARDFPNVRLIRLDRNVGPGEALNRVRGGLAGRYLAYVNQDAVAGRRWLAELVQAITTHPRAGVVESNMILPGWPEYANIDGGDMIERAYVCDLTPLGVQDFRIVPITPSSPPIPLLSAYGAGCIMDPQILDRLGYWFDPEFFAYFDDIDLGLRLNEMGYQVLLAPRSVVYHDTDWQLKWDRRSIRRAFLSTRNMFLVFYKAAYASEFVRLLPALAAGKLMKAGQHTHSTAAKVAYAVAGAPLLLVAGAAALTKMPACRERRRMTLSRRRMPNGWLVESIRKSGSEAYQPPQLAVAEMAGD